MSKNCMGWQFWVTTKSGEQTNWFINNFQVDIIKWRQVIFYNLFKIWIFVEILWVSTNNAFKCVQLCLVIGPDVDKASSNLSKNFQHLSQTFKFIFSSCFDRRSTKKPYTGLVVLEVQPASNKFFYASNHVELVHFMWRFNIVLIWKRIY